MEKDYLSEIFFPIKKELNQWEKSYTRFLKREEKIFIPISQYLLSFPQKEIGPGLVFLSAMAVSCNKFDEDISKQLEKFAISIEAFNTAILIQNSLIQQMGVKNEDLEEDKKKQSYALLFSEYLFSQAFLLLTELGLEEINKKFAEVINLMIEVRIKEMNFINSFNFAEESYIKLVENKTAKLMSLACWAGVEIGKGNNKEKESLKNFGLNFGLSLQIVDDSLKVMDKNNSFIQDLEIKRFNLPLVSLFHFLPWEEKKELVNFLKDEKIKFSRARSLSLVYRAVELALKKAKLFSDKAKENINILPKSLFKESLIALADFPLERLAR